MHDGPILHARDCHGRACAFGRSRARYGAAFVAVHNGLDVPSMMAWISDLGFHCPEWASGLFGNHTEGVEHAPSAHDDTPLSEPPSKHTGSIPSAVQPPPPLVEGPAHATTQEADGATIVNSGVVRVSKTHDAWQQTNLFTIQRNALCFELA